MRTTPTLVLLICLIATACQPKPDNTESGTPIDFEKEKEAIMAVIDGESAAFWNKDYEKWASYWVHESYIRTMGWWQDGGVTVVEGWDDRAKRTREHMEASPEPNPTASNVRRENINIRIFEDVAWLTFDQYGTDTGDSLMDMPGLSRESRILEKHDGQWRIAYVGWLLVN
jgi:hypothetical protein